MFIRSKTWKLRKKEQSKAKESLEILIMSAYPIYDDKQKSKSRKQKKKQSRKEQKDWNDKNRKEYFFRKAHCNFDTTDYVWHITFDDEYRPPTIEEAKRIFKNLMAKVNRHRRKRELPRAKYMAVVEYGKSGKMHWHIIIDGKLHRDLLEALWDKGTSNVDRLQFDDEGIRKLCKYMLKDPKGKKTYVPSRGNLVEPPDPTINDNKFSKREMIKMATNQPTKEEIEKWYPGYILTKFDIKQDEIYGGVYMSIEMRRYVKNNINNIDKNNRKSSNKKE